MLLVHGKIEEPEAVRAEKRAIAEELATLSPEERVAAEAELAKDPLFEELPEGLGQVRLAFGPFLALAMLEFLFFGDVLIDRYLRWLFAM